MKRLFALLLGFMICFVFTTVNANTRTQNKDVGITCVNQVFTPESFIVSYSFAQKETIQESIYSGGYDTGIGLINRNLFNFNIKTTKANNQFKQVIFRHGIGKINI